MKVNTVIIAYRLRRQDYWEGYTERPETEAKEWIAHYKSHGLIVEEFSSMNEYHVDCKKLLDKWEAKRTDRGDRSMNQNYLKVGQYTPATDETEAVIDREFYGQGYIFKDEEAYDTGLDIPCYIPELSDAVYTRQSFLDMMDGQEALARNLFERVDWQHPETLLEEDYANGEYDDCPACGRIFASYGVTECPHCHKKSCEED
jgi:hypothetical protein